jgi:hypothetical protein
VPPPLRQTRLLAILVLALCASLPVTARAAQSATLDIALTPERLGAGTTIVLGIQIATTNNQAPSPLTALNLSYPANLGIATSGLGLATCALTVLETEGPAACPADSLMGHGSALIEVPFGPELIQETGSITTFMAPLQNGNLGLLFYAYGKTPIYAEPIFPGLVLPTIPPYGGRIDVNLPLIPSLPDGPDAALLRLRTTIGPLGLTYYERTHDRTIPYKPRGIVLPEHCPHNGFPFAAEFTFQDDTHTTAHTTVPCPKRGGHAH